MGVKQSLAVKPCPFCSGKADLITDTYEEKRYYVACMDQTCQAAGPWKTDLMSAVACWNRRFNVVGQRNIVRITRTEESTV